MNIRRINSIYDCTVFQEFAWPENLHEFDRFNLLYGQNGSGKTTISRILRNLELHNSPACKVSLQIDDMTVCENDFPDATVPIRVFNREFISDNVFPIGGQDVPPILVLGKESVEKEREIALLKSGLEFAEGSLRDEQSKKKRVSDSLDGHCKVCAKSIKYIVMGPDSGKYNSYNMTHYRRRAQRMLANGDASTYRLGDAERARLIFQHRVTPKEEILERVCVVPDFVTLEEKLAKLLSHTVISEVIMSLRDDPESSKWVHHGLGLHRQQNAPDCIFCGQPILLQRLAVLEGHFNSAYEDFADSLDRLDAEIDGIARHVSKLEAPDGSKIYEQFSHEYEGVRLELKRYQDQVRAYLDSLKMTISKKRARPFDRIAASDFMLPQPDDGALKHLEEIILRHNQSCHNHVSMATEARNMLEGCIVSEGLDKFKILSKQIQDSDTTIEKMQEKVDGLQNQIADLEGEIIGHRRPAEELNRDLLDYLGHGDLQLTVQDHGYAVARNGIQAQQLSEGETTSIALLYFLKSLDDHRFNLRDGIVVLDDPVSSLDTNALFLAHGFIQERTGDAGQLFILTHNLTFLRQTRNWFRRLNGTQKDSSNRQPARFYMLECIPKNGNRRSSIRAMDPLLERYESDYHYLFACIWRRTQQPAGSLEDNYALPNMARRLLEAFLAFRYPCESGNLWKKMQAIPFDRAKRLRILRFVNEYSHGEATLEPGYDPSLLEEARSVLSDLLDLIRSEDETHFYRMVLLVKQEK